eukprot:TRINITY_DN52557_c0_g1_i1.p1 TRINITY_DN52557_c0_g1~~TRINITY_DN52557_c0_g1_i1.p1  ORF type:complete len:241 (-),score=26.47 TRINITY_DN52557_c0_g1_i1:304-936(-)
MMNFERSSCKGAAREIISLPACTFENAHEILRDGGFVACDEEFYYGDDLEDCICPSVSSSAGGKEKQSHPKDLPQAFSSRLWSMDLETGAYTGFRCTHNLPKRVIYAELWMRGEYEERFLKRAVTSLFDAAEACASRRITICLLPEHAASPEIVCSLLYLGFQVSPAQKVPMPNAALALDFIIGLQTGSYSSDTYTGASDCSTCATDDRG